MSTRAGYAVTIRAFIPVAQSDLHQHAKALAEINEAKTLASGMIKPGEVVSADAMFRRMEVEQFDVKPVSRRAKEDNAP